MTKSYVQKLDVISLKREVITDVQIQQPIITFYSYVFAD